MIKSASGRKVKGKEALRGKKRISFSGFWLCWPVSGGIDRGWKEGEKKVGGKKHREEGVVVHHKTSRCLSQGQVLALFLMNSFILFCRLYLHQQQKTASWSASVNALLQGLLSI